MAEKFGPSLDDVWMQGLGELQAVTTYMGVTDPEPPSGPEPMPEQPPIEIEEPSLG